MVFHKIMARPALNRPTDGELAVLRVLWDCGPSTVRAVHEHLNKTQKTGYTTTLKAMQIMRAKGLVQRDDSRWAHVFRPRLTEQQTQQQILKDLMDRAFGGSAQQLVLQALAAKKSSRKELAEIRKLLDKMEGGNK